MLKRDDPDRFPPQKCGLCGAILVPVPTPEGNWVLLCNNPRCERSREYYDEDEIDETLEGWTCRAGFCPTPPPKRTP